MMRAFLSKPKVLQLRNVREASEAPPTNATSRTPNPIVTNEVFTGYISDLEEDEDEAGDFSPNGAHTEERSELAAGSISCARQNPDQTSDANNVHEEGAEVSEGSFRVQEPPGRK